MAISYPVALRNARMSLVADAIDAGAGPGVLRVYAGSVPTNIESVLGGGHLQLVQLTLSSPVFSEVTGGVGVFDTIISGVCSASNTASFFRILDSDGLGVVQGTVGTALPADLIFNTVSFIIGGTVAIPTLSLGTPS